MREEASQDTAEQRTITEQQEGGSVSPKDKSEGKANEIGEGSTPNAMGAEDGQPDGVAGAGQARRDETDETPGANEMMAQEGGNAGQQPNQDMEMEEQHQMDQEEMD